MTAHRRARMATAPDLSPTGGTATAASLIAALPLPAPRPSEEESGGVVIGSPAPDAEAVSVETVSAALKAGARGYLFDGPRRRPYLVATGGDRFSGDGAPSQNPIYAADRPAHVTVPDVNGSPCTLTSHEIEILQHVAAGETNKIIGHRLGMSPGSVKSNLHRIGCRLGTRDRAHMVLLAMRGGAIL